MKWLPLLGALLLGYLAICLLVFLRQRQMLYFPQPVSEEQMLAEAQGLGFSRWLGKDGHPIGWTLPGDEGPPLLIFHGNSGNPLGRAGMIERLRRAGIRVPVYLLDYPGFGSRPGTPTQQTLTQAAGAALEALPTPPVILGESLGSGVASQAAARWPHLIRGLILLTPFDSVTRAAQHHYPFLPVSLLALDRFDSVQALSDFRGPVAVIIGDKDTTTPPAGGKRLFGSLRAPKQLLVLPEAGHNEPLWDMTDDQWRQVWAFVSPAQSS